MPTQVRGLVSSEEIAANDTLYAGDFPRAEVPVKIAQGQVAMKRGTLLGTITVGGKQGLYSDAANDGRQTAVGVLGVDVAAATDGDVPAFMYVTGEFNLDAIPNYDVAAAADLIGKNCYLKTIANDEA
jgi:hypothetical protein